MIAFIDNYDSFTYNLVQFIGEVMLEDRLGDPLRDLRVWRNDQIDVEELAELNPTRILISPGPGPPHGPKPFTWHPSPGAVHAPGSEAPQGPQAGTSMVPFQYSSQREGDIVSIPGPHGGTSFGSMPSANSGVTSISSSISLTSSSTLRKGTPMIGRSMM